MTIWVDADACPKAIKEIIFRRANKDERQVICVANSYIVTPPSKWIRSIVVEKGLDVADQYIIDECQPNDVVITADIPLAAAVLEKNAFALSPRGEVFSKNSIGEKLNLRGFHAEMRSAGSLSGGPPALNEKDKKSFADAFDRALRR